MKWLVGGVVPYQLQPTGLMEIWQQQNACTLLLMPFQNSFSNLSKFRRLCVDVSMYIVFFMYNLLTVFCFVTQWSTTKECIFSF